MSDRIERTFASAFTSRLMRCLRWPTAALDISAPSSDDELDVIHRSRRKTRKRPADGPKEPPRKRVKGVFGSEYDHQRYESTLTADGSQDLFTKRQGKCFDMTSFGTIDTQFTEPPGCYFKRRVILFNTLLTRAIPMFDPYVVLSKLDELRMSKQRKKHYSLDVAQETWAMTTSSGRRVPDVHTVIFAGRTEKTANGPGRRNREFQGIHGDEHVSTLLHEGTGQPIVILGAPARFKPTVEEFCRVYEDECDLHGHPFVLEKQRGLEREVVPVTNMLKELSQPTREGAAATFLPLPNLTNICWTPSFIQQHDLLYHIHLQTGEAHQYRFEEFAVAGSDKSLTMPHVAKLGAATWVAPVIGGKLWGFLAGSPDHRRRLYSMTDFDMIGASDEQTLPSFRTHWVNLAGDLDPVLIVPPGEPSFVIGCGENVCLAGHFYDMQRLDQSWRAITSELFDNGHSNGMYAPRDFEKLTLIVRQHASSLFNDRDREVSCPELVQLVNRYADWKTQDPSPMLGGVECDHLTREAIEEFMSTAAATVTRLGFSGLE